MTSDDTRTARPEGESGPASQATTSSDAANTSLPAALTADEVATLLRVDRKSIYAAVARDEIPGVLRVGRLLRFSREAVLRWVREGQASSRTRRAR